MVIEGLWVKNTEQHWKESLWGILSFGLRHTGMVGHLGPCSWTLERNRCQNWAVKKFREISWVWVMFASVLWVNFLCWRYMGPQAWVQGEWPADTSSVTGDPSLQPAALQKQPGPELGLAEMGWVVWAVGGRRQRGVEEDWDEIKATTLC